MPILDGIKCPVCKSEFQDGDDVVFCPDCGTPHHRECWKLAGRCVNAGLHKTGYNFYDENNLGSKKKKEEKKPAEMPNKTTPEGFYIPGGETASQANEQSEQTKQSVFAQPVNTEFDNETIAGKSAKYYVAAVRTNAVRFLRLFKNFDDGKKKSAWNWGAFFFGPYYLLFRKMYAQGIGLLVLQTLISYLGSYFMSIKAPEFTKLSQSIVEEKSKGTFKSFGLTAADVTNIQNAADYKTAMAVFIVMAVALIALRIIIAVFADKMYFSHIKNLVKTVCEKVDDGATVSTVQGMSSPSELTGEKAKLFYLARKGGTSLFPVLIAYLAISIIPTL